jgi:hypothetical protein
MSKEILVDDGKIIFIHKLSKVSNTLPERRGFRR